MKPQVLPMIRGPCVSNNSSWTKYVEEGTCASILRMVKWRAVKKMDRGLTKVLT
jgi:hypothetical protein